jgi:hypothetical protein
MTVIWSEPRTFNSGNTTLRARAAVSGRDIVTDIWIIEADGDHHTAEAMRDEIRAEYIGKRSKHWQAGIHRAAPAATRTLWARLRKIVRARAP